MMPDVQSAAKRPSVCCPACQTAFPTLAPVAEAVSDPADQPITICWNCEAVVLFNHDFTAGHIPSPEELLVFLQKQPDVCYDLLAMHGHIRLRKMENRHRCN